MTEDRFQELAEAYGGEIARWPEAERDLAFGIAADRPDLAERVLARAGRLDALLDGQTSPEPSAELRQRIVASAPSPRATSRAWRWLAGAGLGAGLAAACA